MFLHFSNMCFVTPIKFCETGRLEVDLALPPSVDIRVDSEMKATTLLAYLGKSILLLINVKYFFDILIFNISLSMKEKK